MSQEKHSKPGTGIKNSVLSAIAALFGIQSNKNRERDFKQGNPLDFIMIGIVTLIVLLFGMALIVKVVLQSNL